MSLPDDDLLAHFGTPRSRVRNAVTQIRQGGGVIVVDDADRENEGDMIFPADTLTVEQMALMIRDGSGIVCLVLDERDARRLDLPPMVSRNSSRHGTAFTISIEAREGVTSGVSAADRVTTIRAAARSEATPADLARPGHVFPLIAHPGGLHARRGHTEATLELVRLAGRGRAGVLCEVMNADGTMARLPDLIRFATDRGLPIVTIDDLVANMTGNFELAVCEEIL
ncbi:3,4-dihydroxy-2-butanone-4-phosphate synthase [Roseomonas gilardii]|uniref:3,4-dihydroxy-2-butanone-4-phosphate synthase n=1 Tax=Roseomonas gilardii TaxID=257708 RepID=UPI00119CBB1A|nr:3,4-dihydroxy-2-butanone-4-phosphate synthase [Roseomonas gilardii]